MKKTSFQIQQYDFGWVKVTRKINSPQKQKEVMEAILEQQKYFVDNNLLYPHYAPLFRMRLRDKSWFYFSINPNYNIQNGKFVC